MPYPAKTDGTARRHLVTARISQIEKEQLLRLLGERTMSQFLADLIATHIAEAARKAAGRDELYEDAVALVLGYGKASLSLLQRRLHIGYHRADGIIQQIVKAGLVDPVTLLPILPPE